MMKISQKICTLALILFVSSCTTSNGNYSAISNKQLSLYNINNGNSLITSKASAVSERHVFVVIPTGKAPTIADAVGEILNKYHGDYLANVSIANKSFQIMWLYHYTSWRVEGDVIRIHR